MIVAFDTYYLEDQAKTVGIAFENWNESEPFQIFEEVVGDIAEYVPGAFYKRELPCILSLLKQIHFPIDTIIVDGFVFLDDQHKLGLGGHLYQSLHQTIPIIGVAKTNFATIKENKVPVHRGESSKPLYITSVGIDKELAAQHIKTMHGEYRFPTLLKHLDTLTRV